MHALIIGYKVTDSFVLLRLSVSYILKACNEIIWQLKKIGNFIKINKNTNIIFFDVSVTSHINSSSFEAFENSSL